MEIAKMARENFSIGVLYNITKNQDNPIKTVGRDIFLSPKPLKYKFLGFCGTGCQHSYAIVTVSDSLSGC